MLHKITWEFDAVRYTCEGTVSTSEFKDGHTKQDDFEPYISKEVWWNVSHHHGYGNDYLRYLQEHDFVHHWLAQELGHSFSRALRYAPMSDEPISFDEFPISVRHEENLVHWCQAALRTYPSWKRKITSFKRASFLDPGFYDGDFLLAYEGRHDYADILRRLKDDIVNFFGGWDLYPNVDPKILFERLNEPYTFA